MPNKSEYQMTKIDSAELVAGQNMFRKLENLNFVIVSNFVLRILDFNTSIHTIRCDVIFINYF